MQRREDAHLSPGELDAVLDSRFGIEAPPPELDELSQACQHLAVCDVCRAKVEMHVAEQSRLGLLKAGTPAGPGPDCPPESEWPWIAAGLNTGTEAEASLRHAAECDHCGPLLRQSMADLANDATVEEETALDQFESSRHAWQDQLVARLCHQPRTGFLAGMREHFLPPRGLPKSAYAWAVAAVAALAAVTFLGILSLQRPSIDNLLAAAYTEQRTLELRIPNAAHAPVRLIRGSADRSRLDRPAQLLESEARIARELTKNPANPGLLQAKGRAELLEWNYSDAIASFERALALEPDSPSLMTDLASAYYERAEADHRATDYSRAVELLGKALKTTPDDSVALFNRAILYERMRLYPEAAEDWRQYLRLDSGSAWSSEAKQRLTAVGQISDSTK